MLFLSASNADEKYACVRCGFWNARDYLQCKQCKHAFTKDEWGLMIYRYERNKKQESLKQYAIITTFVFGVIGIIYLTWL